MPRIMLPGAANTRTEKTPFPGYPTTVKLSLPERILYDYINRAPLVDPELVTSNFTPALGRRVMSAGTERDQLAGAVLRRLSGDLAPQGLSRAAYEHLRRLQLQGIEYAPPSYMDVIPQIGATTRRVPSGLYERRKATLLPQGMI